MQASGLASSVLCDYLQQIHLLQQSCSFKSLAAGVDHENLLNQMLAGAKIAFWTEEDLRAKGFFKTPDAMLQVCTCIQTQCNVALLCVCQAWMQLQIAVPASHKCA